MPDVPTYAEQGFQELVLSEWYGFFLPGKAAPEVVQRAADARSRTAVTSPDVVEAFAQLGLEAMATSPAELAQMVKDENAQLGHRSSSASASRRRTEPPAATAPFAAFMLSFEPD